jgi:hypothetical protein
MKRCCLGPFSRRSLAALALCGYFRVSLLFRVLLSDRKKAREQQQGIQHSLPVLPPFPSFPPSPSFRIFLPILPRSCSHAVSNGKFIPAVGFGTWQAPPEEVY